MDKKFDTMSITKAVIGLLFDIYHRGDVHAKVYKNVELVDALNMRSGIVSPPFEDTYEEHKKCRNVDDVTALCRGILDESAGDGVDKCFSYNDFMYQLLPDVFTWEGGGLDEAFAHFMGGTSGWEWTKDGCGCVFAPNGLSMTKDTAVEFAYRARPHIIRRCTSAPQVPPHLLFDALQDTGVTQYWHGWWVASGAVFAYGWKVQLIAIDRYRIDHVEVVLKGKEQYEYAYKNTTARTIRHFLNPDPPPLVL